MACDRCSSSNVMMASLVLGGSRHTCLDCGHSVQSHSWLTMPKEEFQRHMREAIKNMIEEDSNKD